MCKILDIEVEFIYFCVQHTAITPSALPHCDKPFLCGICYGMQLLSNSFFFFLRSKFIVFLFICTTDLETLKVILSFSCIKISCIFCQIRSAFAMAFATLTNPKTILNLAPNRSILGTIIRPDPVLIERKGGSNGQVTFDSLLPGAGEPLESQYGQQELLCNWQLNVEEEPLPRGDANEHSSGKKRKVSKEKSGKKKAKDNGEVVKVRHGEKRGKKKRHSNQDDSNGFGR